jgi:hypothetical protein
MQSSMQQKSAETYVLTINILERYVISTPMVESVGGALSGNG